MDHRNALKVDLIEAMECLRHWSKAGLMDKNLDIKLKSRN
jgi:hypothetical protein